jgi:hypothetical protein
MASSITKEYYRDILPSRQCSSKFLIPDSDFLAKKPDSCGSQGSLRLLPLQVCLLCFPPRPKVGYFPNDENLMGALNTTSLKCCLLSTDAIDRWGEMHPSVWSFKVASCKHTSLKSTGFCTKKKRLDTFLTYKCTIWQSG